MGERDQTHSYWYIPSAPRVNYSLLVMETAGMMKMASGDGFPLRQGAETGSQLVLRGYRGLWRRNFRSRVLFGGFCIYKKIGLGNKSGGARGAHKPLGRALEACGLLGTLLAQLRCFRILFGSIKNHRKFSAHSENFFLHKKRHHDSSAKNNIGQG